jgi:sugar phosphate isomerase/epimerase
LTRSEPGPRVLASTTSHKAEPLLPTLEIFARLGLRDVDLNLHPILEGGVPLDAVRDAIGRHELRVWALSGGWCDFFDDAPRIEETFRSIERQVEIARALDVTVLRLFFGRLHYEAYTRLKRDTIVANLRRLGGRHAEMRFVLENHDGASLHPEVCREILEGADCAAVRMNFDPINFERAGVDSRRALADLQPFVGHVHLKGLDGGEYCEFGVGDVDLTPVIQSLVAGGYAGRFSVEYEGPHDKTLRLYESMQRARKTLRATET